MLWGLRLRLDLGKKHDWWCLVGSQGDSSLNPNRVWILCIAHLDFCAYLQIGDSICGIVKWLWCWYIRKKAFQDGRTPSFENFLWGLRLQLNLGKTYDWGCLVRSQGDNGLDPSRVCILALARQASPIGFPYIFRCRGQGIASIGDWFSQRYMRQKVFPIWKSFIIWELVLRPEAPNPRSKATSIPIGSGY